MKKILVTILLLSLVTVFAACGEPNTTVYYGSRQTTGSNAASQATTDSSFGFWEDPAPAFPSEKLAEECLLAVISATTVEQITPYLDTDSADRAQALLDYYSKTSPSVTVEYSCSVDSYDVFHYTTVYAPGDGEFEDDYAVLKPQGDRYVVTVNPDVINYVKAQKSCHSCSGSGVVTSGNRNTCGICGGTGSQYIPNAYYDSATGMWMGQHMSCSGCGGAGYTGIGTNITCENCNGTGIDFD